MIENFTELKRQFEALRNDFSERRNTIPRPDEREMIGYPEAIAVCASPWRQKWLNALSCDDWSNP